MLASCVLFLFKMTRLDRYTLIKRTKFICEENILKRVSGENFWFWENCWIWENCSSKPWSKHFFSNRLGLARNSFKQYTIPTEKKKWESLQHGRYKTINQRRFISRKDTNCIGKIIWNGSFCYGSSRVQGNVSAFCWGIIGHSDATE